MGCGNALCVIIKANIYRVVCGCVLTSYDDNDTSFLLYSDSGSLQFKILRLISFFIKL